ncbi:MAG: small multi-drug export protein [Chloroflexi bacterium]|nr:small multi-drug export protein [Chloroflexota bacterium]
MEWAKYLAVALTAMSPIGEELVAIPLGVGLGLPVLPTVILAFICNLIPVAAVSALVRVAQRNRRIAGWLQKLRRERIKRILGRCGAAGVILVTPWVGVYATVATLEVLGMPRRRLYPAVAGSLALYAIVVGLLAYLGVGWFR